MDSVWEGGLGPKIQHHDEYFAMRLKIEEVFEHYAKQSDFYKRANIAQRFLMEDRFHYFSMELLEKIIGPIEI